MTAAPEANSPAMAGSTFSPPPPPPPELSPRHATQQLSQAGAEPLGAQREDWGGVRKCGTVTLSRTCSSASQRFRGADGGSSGIPFAMRRAFSLRRPSSLAEGYWRIHDTGDEDLQQLDGDLVEEQNQQQHTKSASSGGKKKKKGMILKAWKKLFGF